MMLNDLEDRGDTNDSSEGAPGDVMEGRATMVPPTSLSTYVSLDFIFTSFFNISIFIIFFVKLKLSKVKYVAPN